MIRNASIIGILFLAGALPVFSQNTNTDFLSYLKTLKDGGNAASARAVMVGLSADKMILDEGIVSGRVSTSVIRGKDMPDVIFSKFTTKKFTIITKQARSVWYAKLRRNDGAKVTEDEFVSLLRVEDGLPMQTLNFYSSDRDTIKLLFSMIEKENLPSEFPVSYQESIKTLLALVPTWVSEMQFNESDNEIEMWTLKYSGIPMHFPLGYQVGANMWAIDSP